MHHGNFVSKLAIYPCRSDLSFHGRVLPELSEDGFISSQVHHVLLGLFFSWQDHVGSCRIDRHFFDDEIGRLPLFFSGSLR